MFMASQVHAWSCDTAVADLTDPSSRSKCMYRFLSHLIEQIETELLAQYKADLLHTNRINNERHRDQYYISKVEDLNKFQNLLKFVSPQAQSVLITNKASIPMTCSTARSSSS